MKDKENHSLRDGIIATVVGGLILTVLTYLYTPLSTFFQNLYEVIKNYLLAVKYPFYIPMISRQT